MSIEAKKQLGDRIAQHRQDGKTLIDITDIKLAGQDIRGFSKALQEVPILLSPDTLKGSIIDKAVLISLKTYLRDGAYIENCIIKDDINGKVISNPAFGQKYVHYVDFRGINFTNATFEGSLSHVCFIGADLTGTKFEGTVINSPRSIKEDNPQTLVNSINRFLLATSSLTFEKVLGFTKKLFIETQEYGRVKSDKQNGYVMQVTSAVSDFARSLMGFQNSNNQLSCMTTLQNKPVTEVAATTTQEEEVHTLPTTNSYVDNIIKGFKNTCSHETRSR